MRNFSVLALALLSASPPSLVFGFTSPSFLATTRGGHLQQQHVPRMAAVNGKNDDNNKNDDKESEGINGKSNKKPVNGEVNGEANNMKKKNKRMNRSQFASAEKWLDAAVASTMEEGGFDESSFLVGILGDLHIDPRKMDDYEEGHDHWVPIFQRAKQAHGNVAMVSLGDLGESKNCDHNPDNPDELFAGTTLCHTMAAEFLSSFDVPYEGK